MRIRQAALLAAACLTACASPRPKLYPNPRYNEVGEAAAQKDVDACLGEAKAFVKANPMKPVGERAGWGAATGAAMGAVFGLITGDFKRAVTSGAAVGGAGGAVQGTYESTKPDDLVRAYADRCLTEKGYSVLGWR